MDARRVGTPLLLVAIGALLVSGGVRTERLLVVEDLTRNRALHHEQVSAGATFTLDYVHSSERVPVRGTFRVDADQRLTVTETAFGGFGPGLPALTASDAWRIENGMIVHRPPNERLRELRLRIAAMSHQRLRLPSGIQLDLPALTGDGGLLRVSVR